MINFLKQSMTWALSIISLIFTFVPESIFEKFKLLKKASSESNVILNRVMTFLIVSGLVMIGYLIYLRRRQSIQIKGKNYNIKVSYGDIFDISGAKKIISFDECFTTKVGLAPSEIKPGSICGQYLIKCPIENMQALIEKAELKPCENNSLYNNQKRYESGTLIPRGEYLLMAFAKLDEEGLGRITYEEFLHCLSTLWKEIDKYYGQNDVCIPILGSGITRMNDNSLTQQELLDIIIASYQLHAQKIKPPAKLHIVCKKCEDFSINKIGQYM